VLAEVEAIDEDGDGDQPTANANEAGNDANQYADAECEENVHSRASKTKTVTRISTDKHSFRSLVGWAAMAAGGRARSFRC
jgi:hypothetical protein